MRKRKQHRLTFVASLVFRHLQENLSWTSSTSLQVRESLWDGQLIENYWYFRNMIEEVLRHPHP